MSAYGKTIDVNADVRTVYNQWTQFEEFPQFMAGVKGDKKLHWRAEIGGQETEWDVELTEQIPDERVAWRSTSGVPSTGLVTFNKIGQDKTRIMFEMYYGTQEFTEKPGDMNSAVAKQVEGNLDRFKDFIESRGSETGAWRGTIPEDSSKTRH